MADNNSTNNGSSDLLPVTGLWKSKLRNGGTMLSGTVSPGLRLVILPVKERKSDKHPEYTAFFAPANKREEQAPNNPQDDI